MESAATTIKAWRGRFYPAELPARRWLEYASRQFDNIELNGTFYSLKSPAVFERWVAEVADDFSFFAIGKGGRFITHNLKLRNVEASLGNFFASGVLLLGEKTGPLLWQLPGNYRFEADRLDGFMRQLPRMPGEAEAVARRHDHWLRRGSWVERVANVEYRHAFEVRHPTTSARSLLRSPECTPVCVRGRRYGREVPVRRGGDGGFRVRAIARVARALRERVYRCGAGSWAEKIDGWRRGGRDVYVYFDNDAKVHAPFDATEVTCATDLARETSRRPRTPCVTQESYVYTLDS